MRGGGETESGKRSEMCETQVVNLLGERKQTPHVTKKTGR